MTDDLRNRLQALFERIEGGSTQTMDSLIDEAIEEGLLTKEEFDLNELAICHFFDAGWFECAQCGWTMPMECISYNDDNVDLMCSDCSPEENEDA